MVESTENFFSSGSMPSYKIPPVNEVVCGMRFDPPDKLRVTHFGLLWNKFRSDYPIIQHAPPIALAKGELLIDTAIGIPLPRVWFINESDDQLVQFQIDRFYYNWRRKESDYPRYNYVIENFESTRCTIDTFFSKNKLGKLKPIEYELTYINHIPKGQGWNTIDDLPKIFSDFVWKKSKKRFLPNPQKIEWESGFALPEQKGHLIVNLKQAIRTKDKIPLLILELRTRGYSEITTRDDIRAWFDIAHEWIVRGFTDLTTPRMHKIWEREDNA